MLPLIFLGKTTGGACLSKRVGVKEMKSSVLNIIKFKMFIQHLSRDVR